MMQQWCDSGSWKTQRSPWSVGKKRGEWGRSKWAIYLDLSQLSQHKALIMLQEKTDNKA